jgi:hypothetical protein
MWKCSKTPVIFEPEQEQFSRLVGWAGGKFHTEEFDLKAANQVRDRMRWPLK